MNLQKSNRRIEDAKIGDIVNNIHNEIGRISFLDDKRCQVTLDHLDKDYGFIISSITGDNAHDTLNINGYEIYEETV